MTFTIPPAVFLPVQRATAGASASALYSRVRHVHD